MVGASYAIALVQLASESDELEKVHQDMDALASVFAENSEVGRSLRSCLAAGSWQSSSTDRALCRGLQPACVVPR